ncbi:ATP-dependent protease LonB [Alteribacillus sp. HJP-4]|uniref:ATP-dependent protease LonB n=1 Tax=Alteribacillus sp. HJP-4 TaxID=2775394 RepID=UPI0035CCD5BF
MNFTTAALVIQLFFGVIIGLYFWNLLKRQQTQKVSIDKESKKEMEELRKLRSISLSEPLSEKMRPARLEEVIGQEEGIKALKAAICGANPQHVIVYGPPGVGKTAAARLVLEEAKTHADSPFKKEAKFVELDGATARFDERGIADPLIGSVHDPIYQGAGAMGQAGIPQPKHGAVTKAHGGMLFIDEIGELHSIQHNKLLKVLEDRSVFLESAYYNSENKNIPRYIHEVFQRGLPADFRLVGATTRSPEELPAALRSRCMEVFFRSLDPGEIQKIAEEAAEKSGIKIEEKAAELLSSFASNGREAVNIIQTAAGIARADARKLINEADIEWVVKVSRLSQRPEKKVDRSYKIGVVNGLAVTGDGRGMLLEIEATARPASGVCTTTVTGIVEEEQHGSAAHSIKRKSLAKSSVENVMTVLKAMGVPVYDYDVHVNFPGGMPVDGPSAGAAIALAIYSAVNKVHVRYQAAVTGELGLHGDIKPVGGVPEKIEAAIKAGATHIFIPRDNDQQSFRKVKDAVIQPASRLEEILKEATVEVPEKAAEQLPESGQITAAPAGL